MKGILISREVIDDILVYLNDVSINLEKYNLDKYEISNRELELLKKELFKVINKNYIQEITDNRYIDTQDLKKLYDKFVTYRYENIRNEYENKAKQYTDEDIFNVALDIFYEANKIENYNNLFNKIKSSISKLSEVDQTKSLNYELRFDGLKNSKSKIVEYENLFEKISRDLIETYIKNITKLSKIDESNNINILVSKDLKTANILNNENMEDFSYGYIIDPINISPVNDVYKKNNTDKNIDLKYSSPIGIYAVTLGERNLNKNYVEAKKLEYKFPNSKVYELDLLKYKDLINIKPYINSFIDSLIINKGTSINERNDEFYNRFNYFINEYIKLKGTNYDEGKIINTFDFCFNLIYSQKYKDLKELLSGKYTVNEVKEVLNQNIYHDSNIFRYNQITKKEFIKFLTSFYGYKDNEILNTVYPGINVILNESCKLHAEKLDSLIDVINKNKVDSWFISQYLKPTHKNYKNSYIDLTKIEIEEKVMQR